MHRSQVMGMLALALAEHALSQFRDLRFGGWGGIGYDQSTFGAPGLQTQTKILLNELGVNANGSVYDPRLLIFDVNADWNRNQNYLEQFGGSGRALTYNGSFTFLSQRNFPFAFYFSRSNTDADYGFHSALFTIASQYGVRGAIKKSVLGSITYEVAKSSDESGLGGQTQYVGHQRLAGVGLVRNFGDWKMQLNHTYTDTESAFSALRQTNDLTHADLSRSWGDRLRVGILADDSRFRFKDSGSGVASDDTVDMLGVTANWRLTQKLDTYYNLDLSRNAVNPYAVAGLASGLQTPVLPLGNLSFGSSTVSGAAGGTYRWFDDLTLFFSTGYSRNNLPDADLRNLTPVAARYITTGTANAGGGASFRKNLRRLEYRASGSVSYQRFITLVSGSQQGAGYSLDNSISTGDINRRGRVSAAYRYSERRNPVFFSLMNSHDRSASGAAQMRRFGLHLQASAEYSHRAADLIGSRLGADTLILNAIVGFRKLSAYGGYATSNSDQFFVFSTLLARAGAPFGVTPIPSDLLLRPIATDMRGARAGLTWRPRWNLDFSGRFTRDRQLILRQTPTDVLFWRAEILAQYKFGRFTIIGGYGRGDSDAVTGLLLPVENRYNRFFFRVRFPFHVFG